MRWRGQGRGLTRQRNVLGLVRIGTGTDIRIRVRTRAYNIALLVSVEEIKLVVLYLPFVPVFLPLLKSLGLRKHALTARLTHLVFILSVFFSFVGVSLGRVSVRR